jgi:beta-fructofuranosidase
MTDSVDTRLAAATLAAWRPRYHVHGERNWINDPNGPIHRDGRYHLFFQANAEAPFWGPPSWGHVSSADLVTWTRHPVALAPQAGGPDADGCWSGCTQIVDGRPVMYYTGVVGHDEDDRVESVCRAFGSDDLLRWERDPANPLLAGPPAGRASGYHRDPFLWRDAGGWHMLLGSGTADGDRHGQVLRYDSDDATRWTYAGVFFEAPREVDGLDLGEHWECPQLVWGEGESVALILSCQVPGAERPLMHSVAFAGALRGGRLEASAAALIDHGDVFYAPAVCVAEGGRTLLWGWMQERLDPERQGALTHAGALSLPREATLRDGVLHIVAAPEIERLRGAPLERDGDAAEGPAFAGRAQMELLARVTGTAGRAGWALASDGLDAATIVVDAARGQLEVTVLDPVLGERTLVAPLPDRAAHDLRVLVDGSLLEVFADRRQALSTRAYPGGAWESARVTVDGALRVEDVRASALSAEAIA